MINITNLPLLPTSYIPTEFLTLNENELTGPIPEEIGNSANLRSFSAQQNELTGNIPAVFGSLESLETLVRMTCNKIRPPSLTNRKVANIFLHFLPFVFWLYTQNFFFNRMDGPVPAELGNLLLLENRTYSNYFAGFF